MPLPPTIARVQEHRPCRRCGYDLFGLDEQGVCSECGAPVHATGFDRRFADNLTDAPLAYLKRLTLAFWVLALSILLGVGARTLDGFGALPSPVIADAAIVLAASAWFLAVWLATTKRQLTDQTAPDPLLDAIRFRQAIRLTQAAAPFAAISAVAATHAAGPPSVGFAVLAAILGVVAFLGASALCVYLSCLADWAGDTGVAERLRASAWGIAVCGLIALGAAVLSPLVPSLLVVGLWASVFLLLAVCLFAFAIFELGRLTSWAVSNNITAVERDTRVAARRKRESDELADRVTRLDDAVPHALAAPPTPSAEHEEALPLAEPDAENEIDQQLDGISPARPRPSKIRFTRDTFPPVGRHASLHDTPAAPRPRDTDPGEAHYTEHRIEPQRKPDPNPDPDTA